MLKARKLSTEEKQTRGDNNHYQSTTKGSIKRKLSSLFLSGHHKNSSFDVDEELSAVPRTNLVGSSTSKKISLKIKSLSRFLVFSLYQKKPRDVSSLISESSTFSEPSVNSSIPQSRKPGYSKQTVSRRKFKTNKASQVRYSAPATKASEPPLIQQTHHTYNVSLRKLNKIERRPLVQVLLIHQTMSKTRVNLQLKGLHSPNNIRSNKNNIFRKLGHASTITGPPSTPRSLSPKNRCQSLSAIANHDDNVPLGLLQKELLQYNHLTTKMVTVG
ncbi:hypothetical protein K7432_013487 [Basidiobolus ranarum]|uniref:Uncharacterized protein n=1 Tax=Basidiobolus ranarum TaxID=34480 RepID=A0ABR2WJ60_9FUNG